MFDLEKYSNNQKEIISCFRDMYKSSIDGENMMSEELYDMYFWVGTHVLDNPIEIDDLIFSILEESGMLPKNKIVEQQEKIEDLERKFDSLMEVLVKSEATE